VKPCYDSIDLVVGSAYNAFNFKVWYACFSGSVPGMLNEMQT